MHIGVCVENLSKRIASDVCLSKGGGRQTFLRRRFIYLFRVVRTRRRKPAKFNTAIRWLPGVATELKSRWLRPQAVGPAMVCGEMALRRVAMRKSIRDSGACRFCWTAPDAACVA